MISLVTGGAGFIGSHLVRALLARGDRVRVLDNFSTGNPKNLTGLDGSLEIFEGDICNKEHVHEAIEGVDIVFHQAAEVSVLRSMNDPQTRLDVNVAGTLNILESARNAGVQKVVVASSCAVYGDSQIFPLSEDNALSLLSPYAASKHTTEIYARVYTKVFELPIVALRYFNVYGPRQSPQSVDAAVVPIFVRKLLDGNSPVVYGDGTQTRDFVFVKDVVRANILASEHNKASGNVYNVCSGREVSLLDLLEYLAVILPNGSSPQFEPPRVGDIYRSVGNPTLASRKLGFVARTSLYEGLMQVVNWMRGSSK